ncbi:reverse transcriptase domain-containing protein [Tanacetum coccineum]
MNQEKRQEKDEVQIHQFWQMFKQLHINISLADALILIPNELKCKALADLGTSINLMPLSVWKRLGLPELISTQMTLEHANHEIYTPVGIPRDVFVPVGKFTFPADFVIGEEMILCDGNERLILNMRHDTSSYSNEPRQESINMIDVYNVSHEEILKDLFATNNQSGNPTFPSHTDLTSPEVINPSSGNPTPISEPVTKSSSSSHILISIEESDLIWEEFETYLASDSFPSGNSNPSSPLPPFHNSLSGSTTSSSPSLPISETSDYFLKEFAD